MAFIEKLKSVQPWIWIFLGLVGAACFVGLTYEIHHHNNLFHDPQIRMLTSSLVGIVVLLLAFDGIILSSRTIDIQYVIAYDVVAFVILGLVALVPAAYYWSTACLCAGACLLGGGILGLLFGMPLGNEVKNDDVAKATVAAQKAASAATKETDSDAKKALIAKADAAQSHADQNAAGSGSRNLLSSTASSLSKLLAGAGLAKYSTLFILFKTTSWNITRAVNVCPGNCDTWPPNSVLGGAIILYFGLLGFIAGLFLPAYFMRGWQDGGQPHSEQQADDTQ